MTVHTFTLAIDLARFFASSPPDTQREAAIGAVDWGSATPGQIRTLDDALALHEERGTAHARRIAKELRVRLSGWAPGIQHDDATQPAARVAVQDGGQFYALDDGRLVADYGDTGRSDDCASARARFLANNPGWRIATPAELGHYVTQPEASDPTAHVARCMDGLRRDAGPGASAQAQAILDADARDPSGRTLAQLMTCGPSVNDRYVPESVALELRRQCAELQQDRNRTTGQLRDAEHERDSYGRECDTMRTLIRDAYIVLAGATHPGCRKPGDVLSRIAAAVPELLS